MRVGWLDGLGWVRLMGVQQRLQEVQCIYQDCTRLKTPDINSLVRKEGTTHAPTLPPAGDLSRTYHFQQSRIKHSLLPSRHSLLLPLIQHGSGAISGYLSSLLSHSIATPVLVHATPEPTPPGPAQGSSADALELQWTPNPGPRWLVRLAKAETTTGVHMRQGAVRDHIVALVRWGGNRYPPGWNCLPPRLPPSLVVGRTRRCRRALYTPQSASCRTYT